MKPLLVMLLLATSVQAQSLADAARQERERQAAVRPSVVIKETGGPSAPAAGNTNELPKAAVIPAPDPAEAWNAKADELRNKIKDLQDQETALQLQQTTQQDLVYAPVVDPAAKDQAQADLQKTIEALAKTREDLDMSKKELDVMLAEGPPKKSATALAPPSQAPQQTPQP